MKKACTILFFTAILIFSASAPAQTTTIIEQVTTPQPAPGTKRFEVMDIDINKDGILSTNEVGEFLFRLYDTNGNNVIDNIEYEKRVLFTVTPTTKETVITYDFDNDGLVDQRKYTYETFATETQLARFDLNKNGLSAHEFTNNAFNTIDVNNDHAIDINEWRGSYINSIGLKLREKAQLNK